MYSKSTENLKLPQWEHTDHPAFLTDMNQAFKKIDDAVGPQGESLAELQNKVSLLSDLSTSQQEDIEQLRNDVSDHGVQIANLQGNVAVLPEIKNQIETANANYRVMHSVLDRTNDRVLELARFALSRRSATIKFSGNKDGRDININISISRNGTLLILEPTTDNIKEIIHWFYNSVTGPDIAEPIALSPTESIIIRASAEDTNNMFDILEVPVNSRKTYGIGSGVVIDGIGVAFGTYSTWRSNGALVLQFVFNGNREVSMYSNCTAFLQFELEGSVNGN